MAERFIFVRVRDGPWPTHIYALQVGELITPNVFLAVRLGSRSGKPNSETGRILSRLDHVDLSTVGLDGAAAKIQA